MLGLREKMPVLIGIMRGLLTAVCTENLIRVDDVVESPKLAE
jgi:hypothetical protein